MGPVERAPPSNPRFKRRNRYDIYNQRNNYNSNRSISSNNSNSYKIPSPPNNHCGIYYNRHFTTFKEGDGHDQLDDQEDVDSGSLSWRDLDHIADRGDVPSLVRLLTSSPFTEADIDFLCNWRRVAYYFDGLLYLVVSMDDGRLTQAYDAFVQRVAEMKSVSVDWWRWHCKNNLSTWYWWSLHYRRNFASRTEGDKEAIGKGLG